MTCTHNDCFTCPYEDCIKTVEVGTDAKRGRKPLDPEERKKRRRAYNAKYRATHPTYFHDHYLEKTEGKVKRRYRRRNEKTQQG